MNFLNGSLFIFAILLFVKLTFKVFPFSAEFFQIGINKSVAGFLHSRNAQSVEKVKQKCLAFSLICGIINMVMKGAENRKTRKTSDRICMYGRADTGRPSAQKNR